MRLQGARAWLAGEGVAVLLVLAVAAFCLVGGTPMAAADTGGEGHYASGKVCGQSGPFQPLLGVIPHAPPVPSVESPTAWLALRPPAEPTLQVQATPSPPRAPPSLID
jgi:hypothetical protein